MRRLLALNVNHRTAHKPVHPALIQALLAHTPDVLILNEFVEATPRTDLRASLAEAGLCYILLTPRVEYAPRRYTNQVLVASRIPVQQLDLQPNPPSLHASPNLLRFKHDGMILLAMRAPLIEGCTAADWTNYWRWAAGHPADIMIGDLNFDPANPSSRHARPRTICAEAGWRFCTPEGAWSYLGTNRSSRIDHAATREPCTIEQARYLSSGIVPDHTDHAAIMIEV